MEQQNHNQHLHVHETHLYDHDSAQSGLAHSQKTHQRKSQEESEIKTVLDTRTSSVNESKTENVLYTGNDEVFSVDAFEHRLLHDVQFREIIAGRKQGQSWAEPKFNSENSPSRPPAALRITQRPRNRKVLEGSDTTFQAKIQGNPEPKIMWFRNGQQLLLSQRHKMGYENNQATLHIHTTVPEDAGHYTVLAENDIGKVACSTHLVIEALDLNDDAWVSSLHRRTPTTVQREVVISTKDEDTESRSCSSLQRNTMKKCLTEMTVKEDAEAQVIKKLKDEDLDDTEVKREHFNFELHNITPEVQKNVPTGESRSKYMARMYDGILNREIGTDLSSMFQNYKNERKCQNLEVVKDLDNSHKGTFTKIVQRSYLPNGESPVFTKMIVPCRAYEEQSAGFDCKFTGIPAPTVTWYRENCPITTSQDLQITTSPVSSRLVIDRVHTEDSGVFSVEAKNRAGTAKCFANLFVEAPSNTDRMEDQRTTTPDVSHQNPLPAVVCQQAPAILQHLNDIVVKDGQPALFVCRISGVPTPLAVWYRNEKLVRQSKYFTMTTDEDVYSLKISEAFPEDEGTYKCMATNSTGIVTTTATLKVKVSDINEVPPFLSPMASVTVSQGSPAKFTTSVTGHPSPKITWFKDSDIIKSSRDLRITQANGLCSLTIRSAYLENTGTYTCQATNSNGQAKTSATLTIEST